MSGGRWTSARWPGSGWLGSAWIAYMAPGAGMIAYAGSQWLVFTAFLTAGGLRSAGDFSLAQAVAAPVFAFLSLSLRQVWVARPGHFPPYRYILAMRFGTTVLAVALICLLESLLEIGIGWLALGAVLIIKAQEAIADIIYARLDRCGASHLVGLLLGAKGLSFGAIALAATALRMPLDLLVGAIGLAGCLLLIIDACTGLISRSRANQPVDDEAGAGTTAGILWISIANLLISLSGFLPRYALDYVSTRDSTGLFTVVMLPASILTLFATSRAQVALLVFGPAAARKDFGAFKHVLTLEGLRLVAMTAACGLAIYAGSLVLRWSGHGFADVTGTSAIVTLIMIPAVFCQLLSYAFLATGNYRQLAAINAMALVVAGGVALPLIRQDAILGAALVACSPALIQTVLFLKGIRSSFAISTATPR